MTILHYNPNLLFVSTFSPYSSYGCGVVILGCLAFFIFVLCGVPSIICRLFYVTCCRSILAGRFGGRVHSLLTPHLHRVLSSSSFLHHGCGFIFLVGEEVI